MTSVSRKVRIRAIVPAAGMGRRMGRPKQVLRYRGSTLAGTVARTLLEADVYGVVVVTRTSLIHALMLPDDPRVQIAVNDEPAGEMIDSIRIGLARFGGEATQEPTGTKPNVGPVSSRSEHWLQASATDGVLVVPGDMPALSAHVCHRCIDAFGNDPRRIIVATYAGRRGHPIIFPYRMRATVDRLNGGLNELPERYPDRVYLVETDDPGVTRDVDTLADYNGLSVSA